MNGHPGNASRSPSSPVARVPRSARCAVPLVGQVEPLLRVLHCGDEGVEAFGGPLEHLLAQRMEPPRGAGAVRVGEPHERDLRREIRPRELAPDLSHDPVVKLLTRELCMCHRHPPRPNDPSAKLYHPSQTPPSCKFAATQDSPQRGLTLLTVPQRVRSYSATRRFGALRRQACSSRLRKSAARTVARRTITVG